MFQELEIRHDQRISSAKSLSFPAYGNFDIISFPRILHFDYLLLTKSAESACAHANLPNGFVDKSPPPPPTNIFLDES